jgi:hypothetical protein
LTDQEAEQFWFNRRDRHQEFLDMVDLAEEQASRFAGSLERLREYGDCISTDQARRLDDMMREFDMSHDAAFWGFFVKDLRARNRQRRDAAERKADGNAGLFPEL